MSFIKLSWKTKVKHVVFWILLTLFLALVDPVPAPLPIQLLGMAIIMGSYMFIYYSQFLFIYPKYIEKRFACILMVILVYVIYQVIAFTNVFYIMKIFNVPTPWDNSPAYQLGVVTTLLFVIISTMAFGAYKNYDSKLKIQIQEDKEKALLVRELGFFKNQFNPHITFNFLNFCYSYFLSSSKDAADAIELFSDMLRYTLSNKPDQNVQLRHEIEYIENFISLQERLNPEVNVSFQKEGDYKDKYILPRILICFVENAFKHGETQSIDYPISIALNSMADAVYFSVSNRKSRQKTVESTGIGEDNVRQQLELFYSDIYQLDIDEDDTNYSVKLTLSI